ncbi:MAG: superoxide dismutase, Ni [Dehalococcoidia bacterium]|nr:superoxide dismutase, Ni [Dehalococcoidia bacterium]
MKSLFEITRWLPARKAHAHCDIPCGIYDPISAKIAAQTVQKMVLRIQNLAKPEPNAPAAAQLAYTNTLSRYIKVKEDHGEICKRELDILWQDFFNPTHLQKFPDIHDTFWKTEKLVSKNKQEVNMDAAKELVAAVDKIAGMFWEAKGVPNYKDAHADVRFGS